MVARVMMMPGSLVSRSQADLFIVASSGWWARAAAVVVIVQILWALVIPIKNAALIQPPDIIDDRSEVKTTAYPGVSQATATGLQAFTDVQVRAVVNEILELTIGDSNIRRQLEQAQDFAIDTLSPVLPPVQHHLVARYYGLVLQSSEVFAARYTPRQETLIVNMTGKHVPITISCAEDDAVVQGMVCTDKSGAPCDDSSFVGSVPKNGTLLEPVNLQQLLANRTTGWSNSIGLLTFVDFFHQIMRRVLMYQDWSLALQPFQDINGVYNPYRLDTGFDAEGRLVMPDEATLWSSGGAYMKYGKVQFASCAVSEVVLGYVYIRSYVIGMIQEVLLQHNLYNVNLDQVNVHTKVKERAAVIFTQNLSVAVTIGAGASGNDFDDDTASLLSIPMTHKAYSKSLVKGDRPLYGAMLIGSTIRAIWHFLRYPNSFYSYLMPNVSGDVVALDFKLIGAYHSGFNGMKFDFTRNTMAAWKLSEQTQPQALDQINAAFDTEQRYADWFGQGDRAPIIEFVAAALRILGPLATSPEAEISCYRGLVRKMAQVVWVMALRFKPVMNHLVYASMVDSGDPASWTVKHMLNSVLMGEDPYGQRVDIRYVRPSLSTYTGGAWPMVPLLHAFLQSYESEYVLNLLLAELNATYTTLIELEQGLTNFHDVVLCPVGVDRFGVNASDTKPTMYIKIYGALAQLSREIIANVSDMYAAMSNEVAPVAIPRQFVTYNRVHSIFNYEGAPVYWRHPPLALGLIRLTTKEAPIPSDLQAFKQSMVCYDLLELRYLNVSSRCWNEIKSLSEVHQIHAANGLRILTFSFWSMGFVLNVLGAFVAWEYAHNIWKSWNITNREPIPWTLAVKLGIQCLGMLNLLRCTIMAFGVLPLIANFNIRPDPEFLKREQHLPWWWVEILVALSMTWFVRLGVELGRYAIKLRYFNQWFYVTTGYVRNLTILLITCLRVALPVKPNDFDMGLLKLVLTCSLSVFCGYIMVRVSVYFDHAKNPPDLLSQLFADAGFDRSWYGVLAQTSEG